MLSSAPSPRASLPIAGIDGTLRTRFAEDEATGLLRAKTGTLSGISALSGYAALAGHAPIVFAIVSNGFPARHKLRARKAQDALASALARAAPLEAVPQ